MDKKIYFLMALIVACISLVGCSKDDDSGVVDNTTSMEVNESNSFSITINGIKYLAPYKASLYVKSNNRISQLNAVCFNPNTTYPIVDFGIINITRAGLTIKEGEEIGNIASYACIESLSEKEIIHYSGNSYISGSAIVTKVEPYAITVKFDEYTFMVSEITNSKPGKTLKISGQITFSDLEYMSAQNQ